MKRATRFLARLYPAPWRRRYGTEFDALLEDNPASWRSLVNVLLGAFKMQLTNWNFVKIVMATAVFGALAGIAGSFAIPKVYQSTAVIRMAGSSDPSVLADEMMAIQQQTLSRASLTRIILSLDLYPNGQAPSEIQQAIETMRKHIEVRATHHPSPVFVVAFADADPRKAAQTLKHLTAALLDTSIAQRANNGSSLLLDVLDPPSVPVKPMSPNRLEVAGFGMGAGTALGALLGLLTFHFGRIVVATALVGTLAAAVGSFAIPKTYRSRALLRIRAPDDQVKSAIENVLSNNSLSTRKTLRLQRVQGMMQPPTFMVQFDDRDPVVAQRVVGEVLDSFNRAAPQTLRVIDPAILPTAPISPNRLAFAGWGLLAGMGAGLLLIVSRRIVDGSRRPRSTPDGTS